MTISVTELVHQLNSKFDVKIAQDIGSVSHDPGALLRTLDNVYQIAYESNDRIVFYTSRTISEDLLKHLYETANFIDISNWFILICGPDSMSAAIIDACKKYSSDPVPFQFWSADLESTQEIKNKFLLPDTICAIPWLSLEIKTTGSITPCCMSTDISLGNINDTKLNEVMLGKKMTDFRNDLAQGKKPKECQNCWAVEEKGLTSIRMHNTKRLKKTLLLNFNNPTLVGLDIKFNNTCNFKCRICGSESSSLIAQEQHKFRNIPLIPSSHWEESQMFLDQIIEHLPTITNIDMYGGEPFLIKKFSRVLDMAVKNDYAKNIRLHYNSNGSVWPKEFIKAWSHFKEVDIHFSIDDLGPRFELQRGGVWSDVEKNILDLKNLGLKNLNICIMPTISVMNIYYLDELYNWATKHNFNIFVSHVRSDGLNLSQLTPLAREMIKKKYQNHPWTEMKKILSILDQLPNSDNKKFHETTAWFDQVREQNFAESHSEMASFMGYVYNRES